MPSSMESKSLALGSSIPVCSIALRKAKTSSKEMEASLLLKVVLLLVILLSESEAVGDEGL